jgi:hypothetical protein
MCTKCAQKKKIAYAIAMIVSSIAFYLFYA